MTTNEAVAVPENETAMFGRRLEEVTRVYIGKAGKCCCGCSGKYHDSARMKNKVWKVIAALGPRRDDGKAAYVFAETDRKLFIAYF